MRVMLAAIFGLGYLFYWGGGEHENRSEDHWRIFGVVGRDMGVAGDQSAARQFHDGANSMGGLRRHCRRGGYHSLAHGEPATDGPLIGSRVKRGTYRASPGTAGGEVGRPAQLTPSRSWTRQKRL